MEDQGRGRPLRLTDLERVKYKDSVCNKCGAKGHHGRHCTEPEAKCFECGSTQHKVSNCPVRAAKGKGRGSSDRLPSRGARLKFDRNSVEPEQVAMGKQRGYRYFYEDGVEANTTVVITGIPPDVNEEDWLPHLIKGGHLNWGWANKRVVAVNVLRDTCPTRDRNLVNCGQAFVKFKSRSDVTAWVNEFDGLVLQARSGEAKLRMQRAKRDLVSYSPAVKGPMAMRVYEDVWDILNPRVEE